MRRMLANPPKGFDYEVLGTLVQAYLNTADDVEPFSFEPYRPYFCPVCGEDSGLSDDKLATIMSLEYEDGARYTFTVWTHESCLELCAQTTIPDARLE